MQGCVESKKASTESTENQTGGIQMNYNSELYEDVISALLRMEHSEYTATLAANSIMNNSETEEDIIKALNAFGDIIGAV